MLSDDTGSIGFILTAYVGFAADGESALHAGRLLRRELLEEWNACGSCRRMLIALNEAGIDLRPVANLLVSTAAELGASSPPRLEEIRWEYQRAMYAIQFFESEHMACDLIRALHPDPPLESMPGFLCGKGRGPADLNPRFWVTRLGGDSSLED